MSECCSTRGGSCGCGSQEVKELEAVLQTWIRALGAGSPDAVMTLYADNAVSLPADATQIHDSIPKRLSYFQELTSLQNVQGFVDQLCTRLHDDIGVNAGIMTLRYRKNGQNISRQENFTFTYKRTPFGWLILQHHASPVVVAE